MFVTVSCFYLMPPRRTAFSLFYEHRCPDGALMSRGSHACAHRACRTLYWIPQPLEGASPAPQADSARACVCGVRRERADDQPAADGDGRLQRQHGRHRHGRHQPPRRARHRPHAPGALRPRHPPAPAQPGGPLCCWPLPAPPNLPSSTWRPVTRTPYHPQNVPCPTWRSVLDRSSRSRTSSRTCIAEEVQSAQAVRMPLIPA